jgi:curved DNA-binding protein CbpA
MARPLDPYRTLELPRDATLDDVKAAYRRLAKLYHPDSAGERALTRFLAVQAAYEALTEGPGRLRPVIGGRARPATPAPGRPSSTRTGRRPDPWAGRPTGTGPRAARGATGSPGAAGASSTGHGAPAGSGSAGAAGSAGSAGASSGGGATGGWAGSSRTRGPAGPRPRRTRRPPGSTSYDGAESEPFEPEWQGASWYGGSSGTYWTINPREFADPRKHGPDYLARGAESGRGTPRARRARAGDATAGAPRTGATAPGADARTSGSEWPAGSDDAPDDAWTTHPAGRAAAEARPGRPSAADVSPLALIAAALLAIALVATLFAVMAEPTAPGSLSIVPVVAFSGVAILALLRILLSNRRRRA